MLRRASPAIRASSGLSAPGASFLPFLYCTRTILRPYNAIKAPRKPARKYDESKKDNNEAFVKPRKASGSRYAQAQEYSLDDVFSKEEADQEVVAQEQSKKPFGDAGFKVNDPWEETWKDNPPKRRTSRFPPQDSESAVKEQNEDDEYAPFGGWSGPATENSEPRRPKRSHRDTSHVPFERARDGASHTDQHADLEGTTITPNEKKAFESLFKLQKASAPATAASQPNITYKKVGRHDENTDSPLHPVIHKVGTTTPSLDTMWSSRPAPEFPEPLRKLREATLAAQTEDSPAKAEAQKDAFDSAFFEGVKGKIRTMSAAEQATAETKDNVQRDIFAVKQLLSAAQSDVEVWNLLQKRVLGRVVALRLDGPVDLEEGREQQPAIEGPGVDQKAVSVPNANAAQDSEQQTAPDEHSADPDFLQTLSSTDLRPTLTINSSTDSLDSLDGTTLSGSSETFEYIQQRRQLEALSASLPKHLINAFQILTRNFPASPLPLCLIPLLKSIGPSTAALGLSTELYNLHLRHHWYQYRDLIAIDDILAEMNADVYEFDEITHNIVSSILDWVRDARDGEHGPTMALVTKMDRALRGEKAVKGWMNVMTRRRYDEALRKAREMEERERIEREEEEDRRATEGVGLVGAGEVKF